MTEEFRGNRNEDKPFSQQRWTFNKSISVETIVAVMGVVALFGGPIYLWARELENANRLTDARVKVLELNYEQNIKQSQALSLDARDQRIAILQRMDTMDAQITALRIEMARIAPTAKAR